MPHAFLASGFQPLGARRAGVLLHSFHRAGVLRLHGGAGAPGDGERARPARTPYWRSARWVACAAD